MAKEKNTTSEVAEIPAIDPTPVEQQVNVPLHIRDFLHLTKALRDDFTIFEKKYESSGTKEIPEWQKLTGLKANKAKI